MTSRSVIPVLTVDNGSLPPQRDVRRVAEQVEKDELDVEGSPTSPTPNDPSEDRSSEVSMHWLAVPPAALADIT